MKAIFYIILFLLFTSPALAHGYPTEGDFQTFPGTITETVIANPAGLIMVVPFSIIGTIIGLVATPFNSPESIAEGGLMGGIAGYIVGQQIGWPFYGVEEFILWLF